MSNPRRRLVQSLVCAIAPVGSTFLLPPTPAAAAVSATVRTGGGPLNVRAAASSSSQRIATIPDGSPASIACYVLGERVSGAVRTTRQWNRLVKGGYVSHAYLSMSQGVAPCDAGSAPRSRAPTGPTRPGEPAGPGSGKQPTASSGTVATEGDGVRLRLRAGPGTSYQQLGTIANGTTLAIVCQVTGQLIPGPSGTSGQWDKLTTGSYVSHAYVNSGPIPACQQGVPPGGATIPASDQPVAGVVRSDHGSVRIRSGWSTGYAILGWARPGTTITIKCTVGGQYISGTVRGTAGWDRLVGGGFISHAYVVAKGVIPVCAEGGSSGPSAAGDRAEFIAQAAEPAKRAWREYRVPVSVTIAQSIIESGWGGSELSRVHNNYFGIKCWNGWRGSIATGCASYRTFECEPSCRTTRDSFRTYDSVVDSFRDHSTFLRTNSRYRSAFRYSNDPNRFLYAVWQAGYATDPTYYDHVTSLMLDYNLYQYDQV